MYSIPTRIASDTKESGCVARRRINTGSHEGSSGATQWRTAWPGAASSFHVVDGARPCVSWAGGAHAGGDFILSWLSEAEGKLHLPEPREQCSGSKEARVLCLCSETPNLSCSHLHSTYGATSLALKTKNKPQTTVIILDCARI